MADKIQELIDESNLDFNEIEEAEGVQIEHRGDANYVHLTDEETEEWIARMQAKLIYNKKDKQGS